MENSKLYIKSDHSAGQNNSKPAQADCFIGNCFTERQEQGLLKTTLKGFQIFDNETALLLKLFPTTI